MRRLRRGETVALATANPGKVAEFAWLLGPFGLAVRDAAALGLSSPAEDAPDFAGNARIKARAAAAASGLPALADDSGFGLAALDGAPGVRSARFAADGDYAAAMARLRDAARDRPDRAAFFTCALCLALPDGADAVFTGRVEGAWVWPPRGTGGFGYDPMFEPAGSALTFAEMDRAAKAALSHRARAFASFAASCLPEAP